MAIGNNVGTTAKQQTPFGPQFHERGPLISVALEAVEDIPIDSRESAPSLDVSPGCSLSFRGSDGTQPNRARYVSKVADTMRPSENADRLTATFPAPGGPGAFAIEISEVQIVRGDRRRVVPGKATNHPSLSLSLSFSLSSSVLAVPLFFDPPGPATIRSKMTLTRLASRRADGQLPNRLCIAAATHQLIESPSR